MRRFRPVCRNTHLHQLISSSLPLPGCQFVRLGFSSLPIDGGAGDTGIAQWVIDHAAPGLGERLADYRERALAPVSGEMREYLDGALSDLD